MVPSTLKWVCKICYFDAVERKRIIIRLFVLSGDVTAIARGTMSSFHKHGEEYFKLDKLDLDLDIKDIKMQVKKIFHNNRILGEYLRNDEIIHADYPL